MNLEFIVDMYIPVVMVICLCVGFIMKKFLPTDNKFIPLTLAILGAVLGCIVAKDIAIDHIAAGMVTGLAAVGLHQVFAQLLGLDNKDLPPQSLEDLGGDQDDEEEEPGEE